VSWLVPAATIGDALSPVGSTWQAGDRCELIVSPGRSSHGNSLALAGNATVEHEPAEAAVLSGRSGASKMLDNGQEIEGK
jgi:hypothetical protein